MNLRSGRADRLARLAALGVLLAVAAGCARAPSGAADTDTLVRGNMSGPDSLDPQKARTTQAQEILRDLCEGLTTLAKDASVAPGIARDWTRDEAGLTYTFHLRPARWSNGDPLVAEDFVAGLRRLVDPATASPYADVVDVIAGATQVIAGHAPPTALGVAAPDPATVVVRLRAPAPYLPALLAHPSTCPVHRPTLAQHGAAAFARAGTLVSDGAFVLEEWVPGSHVLLKRNHRYWNDAATRIEAVRYLEIADESAELTRYRAGELDVTAVVPRSQLDWIRAHIASELHVSPQLTTYFYGFNLDRAPFRTDVRVRRALSMVIDRERLAASVLRAGELPAYGWIPPGIHDYSPQSFDYRTLPMSERVTEARRLLAASGYSVAKPLSFELRYSSDEISGQLAVAIASMWQQALGVQTRLIAIDFKSLLSDIERRDVEVFRSSWAGDYNDPYTFAQYLKSDFGVNLPHYHSADYDALVDAAAATVEPARRRTLLEQAEQVALRDHPLVPIYFYVNKHLVKPRVHGWYDNVLNVVYSKDLSLSPAG